MKYDQRKQILYKLAVEHGITVAQAEEIANSQFKYVSHVMKEGNFDSVRLPYLGIFKVKPYRLKKVKERNEGKGE